LRFNDPRRIDFRRDGDRLFFSPSLKPTEAFKDMSSHFVDMIRGDFVLAPGAETEIECDLSEPGLYGVMAPTVHALCYVITAEGGESRVVLDCIDGQFIPDSVSMRPGKVAIRVRNRSDYSIPGCVAYVGPHDLVDPSAADAGAPPIYEFRSFMTGK